MISSAVCTWLCSHISYRAFPSFVYQYVVDLIPMIPSGDVQVYSLLFGCSNHVFMIPKLFPSQNFTSLSPASFCFPSPCPPIVSPSPPWWCPTFALKSPMIIITSPFGVLSMVLCSLLKKLSCSSSDAFDAGASYLYNYHVYFLSSESYAQYSVAHLVIAHYCICT